MANLANLRSPMPVNAGHSLNTGRVAWLLVTPNRDAGTSWPGLLSRVNGTLTNFTAAYGLRNQTSRPGGYGHVSFDGVDDYVALGSPSVLSFGSGNFSVAVSFKTTTSARTTLINKYVSAADTGWFVDILATGVLRFAVSTASGANVYTQDSAATVNDGAWHRAMFVRSGTVLLVYVDGVLSTGTISSASTIGSADVGASPVTLGLLTGAFSSYFPGVMDDIPFWNRALVASEVKYEYGQSRVGHPGELIFPPQLNRQFVSHDLTLALTGQSLTAAQGSLTPANTIPLSGQSATLAAGSVSPAIVAALSGLSLTAALGSLTPGLSLGLTGQESPFALGSLGVSRSVALTGQAVVMSQGTLVFTTPPIPITLSGGYKDGITQSGGYKDGVKISGGQA